MIGDQSLLFPDIVEGIPAGVPASGTHFWRQGQFTAYYPVHRYGLQALIAFSQKVEPQAYHIVGDKAVATTSQDGQYAIVEGTGPGLVESYGRSGINTVRVLGVGSHGLNIGHL